MGRKSKKTGEPAPVKPTCFYCSRSFENEDVLISHQKLLHFRCSECGKKFANAPGMSIHMKTMHDIELKSVPKADPGRDDPTLNIVGTTGVPTEEEREEAARKRAKFSTSAVDILVDSVLASVAQSSDPHSAAKYDDWPALPTVKGLVYSDETISPEEKRAALPRYRVDETSLKEKLAAMDASIAARLQSALAARNRIKPDSE